MKIITKTCTPRRTGLIARVRQAEAKGLKSIPLETAVDVYGAQNLACQLKNRIGIKVAVRRHGNSIRLLINPTSPSKRPFAKMKDKLKHTRMRNAIRSLKYGQCLAINTPLEAHSLCSVRASLRDHEGLLLRQMRNCVAVWVWKDKQVPAR